MSARKAAREQALAEIPRQLKELRQELDELRKRTRKDDPQETRGTNKAFTLLELLVVLAVLAILASLLLPALATARARARIAACRNNLGQMGKGLTMYEADFRYFPGAGNDLTPIDRPPWFVLSDESWLAKVTPYLGTNSRYSPVPITNRSRRFHNRTDTTPEAVAR